MPSIKRVNEFAEKTEVLRENDRGLRIRPFFESNDEQWKRICPEDRGIPRDIGARNPYALAEAINGAPIKWRTDPDKFLENRELLMSQLNKKFMLEYKNLFTPEFKSPLFQKFIKLNPSVISAYLSSKPDTVQSEGNPCTDYGDHWNVPAICCYYFPGRMTLNDIVDDVIQGCTRSCYFMAALCSTVWSLFPNFPPDKAEKNLYEITYTYPNQGGTKKVTVSKDLVLNQNNTPVFARPPVNTNEIWPAVYEKAYAVFLPLSQSNLPYSGNYSDYPRPNIPEFKGGNPIEALEHITGYAWTLDSTYFTIKKVQPDGTWRLMSAAECWDKIYGACISADPAAKKRTKYPMVAYTYYDETDAGTGITYGNEIIVANHSYSILGIYVWNSNNYIVLRNPYGKLWGADPNDPEFKKVLAGGTWNPTGFSRQMIGDNGISFDDGIFALKVDEFIKYFKAFGWVT
jgi:hypothetical protein